MERIQGVFYARYMDDWVVLTKSKTALRKVVKITHTILNALKLKMHPTKTYLGKINHGFNFLGYYMDDKKILPSIESINRFSERAVALYECPNNTSRRFNRNPHGRDISEYHAAEAEPSDEYFKDLLNDIRLMASTKQDLDVWGAPVPQTMGVLANCRIIFT
jgi:hypothetical protein